MNILKQIFLLFSFLFLVIDGNSQRKINDDFNAFWLLEKYYRGIEIGKTPNMYQLEGSLVKAIYIYKDTSIIMMSSFWEGSFVKYIPLSENEIVVPDSPGVTPKIILKLMELNGKKIMKAIEGNNVYTFYSLPEGYRSLDGLKKYLRDSFFTGKYKMNNSSQNTVNFYTDGRVEGLPDFEYYEVPTAGADIPPRMNLVILRSPKNKSYKILQWKHCGVKLTFFDVEGGLKKIYTLTKIDK